MLQPSNDYHQHKQLLAQFKNDHKINSELLLILQALPTLDLRIEEWTIQTELFLKVRLSLDYDVSFELKTRKTKT